MTAPPADASLARLDQRLEILERRFAVHPVVDGLERLAALREGGRLTREEFRAAKRRLLGLDA